MKNKKYTVNQILWRFQRLTIRSFTMYVNNTITMDRSIMYDNMIRKATLNMIAKTIKQ